MESSQHTDGGDMAGQLMTIRLGRMDAQPWGFRLQGGKDFAAPLVVQKVNGGSLAEQAGLLAGDALIKVNNLDVFNMRHKDAQDLIVRSGNTFDITIQRGGSVWRPQVTPTGSIPSPASQYNSVPTVTQTSLAYKPQEVRHIGSGYNNAARPFSSVNGNDGQVKSIVNKQYNTPVGIYSEEAIAETLSAQAEVLAGGVLGVNFKKNEKIYNAANSEVLKMLHEQENDNEPDNQPRPISPVTKHVIAPVDRPKAPNTGGLPAGQNICAECERLIVGVFVRIKDKNLHSECFKCATCGTNLKNQGYFNFNNKLYCDIHARLAAMNNPPKGTDGYVPVPMKPATKLSANTISAALDSFTQHNGSSNHETNAIVNISSVSPSFPTHSRTSSSSSSINSSVGISSSHSSTISSLSPDKSMSSPEKLSPAHSRQSSENGSTNVFVHHQHYPLTGTGTIRTNSRTMSPVMPSPPSPPPPPLPLDQQILPPPPHPAATRSYSNEITINHKPKETDVKNGSRVNNNGIIECIGNGGRIPNNGSGISNGSTNDGGRDGNGNTSGYDTETGSDSGQQVLPSSQTKVFNKFLKKYSNKMQNDFLDGSCVSNDNKSYSVTTSTTATLPKLKVSSGLKSKNINDSNDSNGSIKMASTITGSYPSNQNGYGDTNDPIYGTIRPETRKSNEEFKYVTLDGSVIRSVVPPGKGVQTNYKLNTGYGGPKPFNSSPMSPPMRGPQSPSIYPPPTTAQTWDTPTKPQSKPQVNPYATLPRTAGHSHEENQQQCYMYEKQVCEQQQFQKERSIFEEDIEVMETNRQQAGNFKWPPPADDNRNTPTATPLYIPPPETQRVVPKPLAEKPPEQQWQSRSAPELTNQQKAVEIESSSDSYTSTSTTTTTTSEEYHRMYQAQVQAYQMQQAYEQYGSEMDYHMDMEVAAMQQNQSFASVDFYSAHSGRRSAQECVEYLTGPVGTQHLVDLVRAVTPKPETPTPKPQNQRKVEFSDEVQIQQGKLAMAKKLSEEAMERQSDRKQKQENYQEHKIVKEERNVEFRPVPAVVTPETRKFTATPEIKIEIPEVKPLPPSNIPNPVPKEWISPMVRALTTVPDKPIEMAETSLSEATKLFESVHFHEERTINVQDLQETPAEKPPVEPEILKEEPPKGSFISRTMTTAPSDPLKFLDNYNDPVPLPEETEPYMPPPIDMKPYYREDYRPKSPFLSALTVAPDRPYTPYGHDVCSQLLDLPTPKEKLTMVDALTVASSRGYTPLNVVNTTVVSGEQKVSGNTNNYELFNQSQNASDQLCQSVDTTCASRQTSAFTNVKGDSMFNPFQPRRESLNSSQANDVQRTEQNSLVSQAQTMVSEKRDSFQSQQRITSMQQQSTFQSVSSSTTATAATSYFHSMNQSPCTQSSAICENERSKCQQSNLIERQQQVQQQIQQQQQNQQLQKSQDSEQKLSFPPAPGPMAKKTLHSGLHKPDNIPQYQRNWTVLPTQRPVRTPEPPELKENVPLAFVDTHTPRELTPSIECTIQAKAVAVSSSSSSTTKQHATTTFTETKVSETQKRSQECQLRSQDCQQRSQECQQRSQECQQRSQECQQRSQECQQRSQECQQRTEERYKTALPIIVTENNAPVTMAFQSLDDVDHSHAHPRPYTPSLINKPAPVIPYYQTPEKLVSEECPATRARLYDPRSPSPLPDRARSPAPGPPPNPLSTIRAPRIKEPAPAEAVSNYRPSSRSELIPTYRPPIQTGSITTGQSYYGTQNAQFQTQEQGHTVSHYQTGYQAGSQRYTDKPEVYQKTQIGDTTIQTRSKESQFNEENRSALETKSTTQVGNTQIERRRRVTEEFEHTQTAKTIEIRKTQGGEVKQITQSQPTGRTGFVANQARRLSNLEQEISSISSQSKAISARAANLAPSPNFPRYKSPEPISTFPIRSPMPLNDEPTRPTYVVSSGPTNQMVGDSASKKAFNAAQMAPYTPYTPSSQQQYQQQSKSDSQSQSISTGITNLPAATSLQTIPDHNGPTALGKVGSENDLDLPPPPPPLPGALQNRPVNRPFKVASPSGNRTAKPFRPGLATEMLTNSLEKVDISDKEKFRDEASKIISAMLENRLAQKNNKSLTKDFDPNHPMKKIIDVLDNSATSITGAEPVVPETNGKQMVGLTLEVSTDGKVLSGNPTELGPSETVVYRNKSTNPNGKRELSTHAFDRRSYIDTNQEPSDPEVKESNDNTTALVSDLKDGKQPVCCHCNIKITRGPFITALGRIWCPEHFVCVNGNCRRPLQDIGFVEEKGDLYCEFCFEKYLAPTCSRCNTKIKGDCLNAIGKHYHPECFTCSYCGKLFGNSPFFLEEGEAYCEADWNELFTTKCFACGFPVEAGDRWVEALNHNYHSQCFNCTMCKKNLEGQSFYNKGGRPFCKNHAR